MPNPIPLHVGIADLPPVRVAHKLCAFPEASTAKYWSRIHKTFQFLREWVVTFGLDPDTLLHIGVPVVDSQGLVTCDCCIEFPLPIEEEDDGMTQKSLSGGTYAVLRIEKAPAKIAKAIRQFRGDYIAEHHLIPDSSRPIYGIYYKDTMEYCLPIVR